MVAVQTHLSEFIDALAAEAVESDAENRLTARSAAILRESGIVRMLQPRDRGGAEAHPSEFCATIIELASKAPSAGWVAGVVGVHPWQFAWLDERLQEEVWGADPDTWISSPYAPQGVGRRVEGGYLLTGRWNFSTGTDHSEWVVLGGLEADADGTLIPGAVRHYILPRADYEIDQESWDVGGLRGTGSKDVVIKDAFVPDYRAPDASGVFSGSLACENRPGNPLYALPFNVMFPAAVASATLGIAKGVVDRYAEYMAGRFDAMGLAVTSNPFRMAALATADSDMQASQQHLLGDLTRLYELAAEGVVITPAMHYEARRNQVRAVRRASEAANLVFRHAGANANRIGNPIQRFHRDLSIAMGHAANQDDTINAAWGAFSLGVPIPSSVYI